MTVKVGVIGCGNIGAEHARRLSGAVVGVADSDPARAAAVAATLPGVRTFTSGLELVASPDINAVLVASWGPTHEEYVLAAIAAGKPVFCEKPLAPTEPACRRIIDAELKHGRRLVQLGFMRRFDEDYLALRDVIQSGEIGAPLFFHSVHRNPGVPGHYTSDMALNDTCVHDIDIARFLLNDEIVTVSVLAPRGHAASVEPLLVVMQTERGALVDVEVSVTIEYGYDIRGEVVGERGTATLADRNPVLVRSRGRFAGAVPPDFQGRFARAFEAELRAWLAAAADGTATGPSAWDGLAATVVSDAALAAKASGAREPVRMGERPALYRAA